MEEGIKPNKPILWAGMTTLYFSIWMKNIFLLHMHCLPGRKLLLCDDLASHILVEVIDLCRESNVEFVCRPTPLTIAAT